MTDSLKLSRKIIYIAGINGLVGSAIARNLSHRDDVKVLGHSSNELDLLDFDKTFKSLSMLKIDVLVIAAARVGGILANSQNPVRFLNENLRIQLNLFEIAHQLNIDRVLFLGSSCIYPKLSAQPISELSLLSGQLEETNKAYAIAKITGISQVHAYRKEYGRSWISCMPTNLYGPNDSFNDNHSHVIPGLMQRLHRGKIENSKSVTAWGTGNPLREFLHVDDLADACVFLLENYNDDLHINIGSEEEISIKVLSELISSVVGFKGEIHWNVDLPDGTPRKKLDTSKLNGLGWFPKISLLDGLTQTYQWFLKNESEIRFEN